MFRKHFSPFLALRYLKPKRSFVSVITLISVMGVALGVMILVVVIAVFVILFNLVVDLLYALLDPRVRYD